MSDEHHAPEDLLRRAGVLDPDVPTTRIDTHAATILLNGSRAWKVKRPVRFRYLDFSTVEKRCAALQAELELNARTAPQLYLGLHSISLDSAGSPVLDCPGTPCEWVLEMVRFPDDALAVHRVEPDGTGLDDATLRRLAERIVDLHRGAEVSDDAQGAARLQEVVDGNLASMLVCGDVLDPDRARELTDRLTAMITTHSTLLDARAAAGRVRHGHGDLHLGNIAVVDGEPVPFDCLEFDPEMATTDVLYDLGFLVMDLWARGLRHEANIVVNAYLDASPDDEDGYCLLPVILGVRATVRAHVCAAEKLGDRAREYLDLALAFTRPESPRLIAIGGGSGTGKTTVARQVAGDVDPAPGARILRSDLLRKRLAGVHPETRLPASGYTPEMSARVYREVNRIAAQDLAGGMSVIADAVFGRSAARAAVAEVASSNDVPFTGIWLELPEELRISRIEGRGPDASDADAAVARRQSVMLEPPDDWEHVDASAPPTSL